MGGCDDALLIYDASNYSNFYVVKSPVISLQRIHLLLHLNSQDLLSQIHWHSAFLATHEGKTNASNLILV